MENLRIVCTPFLLTAIVFTLAMFYYDQSWKRKNPWWRQNDCKMRISPAKQNYRSRERQKLNNALMSWFAVLFFIIGLMVFVLTSHTEDASADSGGDWFYLLPIIGAIMLAISGIKWRKK